MNLKRTNEEYVTAFKRSLSLLKDYAVQYDRGKIEYALPIATQLRVLFHTTSNGTGLIDALIQKHILTFSPKGSFNMVSFAPGYQLGFNPPTVRSMLCKYYIEIKQIGQGEDRFFPLPVKREDVSIVGALSLECWWKNSYVLVFPEQATDEVHSNFQKRYFTRKDIVLALANKEGGAHVDSKLSHEVAALTQNLVMPLKVRSAATGAVCCAKLDSLLFAIVRTIAEEVLQTFKSADLSERRS